MHIENDYAMMLFLTEMLPCKQSLEEPICFQCTNHYNHKVKYVSMREQPLQCCGTDEATARIDYLTSLRL